MAIERAPNAAMEAGVLGNLGALLLGVAGRVEDSLDLIERSIKRFSEARLVANPLYAGALHRARAEQAGLSRPMLSPPSHQPPKPAVVQSGTRHSSTPAHLTSTASVSGAWTGTPMRAGSRLPL
jgi:hypothetical protein